MPFVFITTDQTTQTVVGTDDVVFVTPGTVITSLDRAFSSQNTVQNTSITVAGDIFVGDRIHDFLANVDTTAYFEVTATGSLVSNGHGLGYGSNVETTFINHGSISTQDYAFLHQGGENLSFLNTGTITSSDVARFDFGTVVLLDTGNDASIVNTGLIAISAVSGAAAIAVRGGDVDIVNTGEIISGGTTAIRLSNRADSLALSNQGFIEGNIVLENATAFADITNAGVIVGDILLADLADTYRAVGDGVVQGQVSGGAGADTMSGGSEADLFLGDDDDDSLFGNGGDDALLGGAGNDTLNGGDGNDVLFGDRGEDLLIGGDGDDTILGSDDNDTVFAGSGDDDVAGDGGNDRLTGGDGNDTILGGSGRDTLFGGEGDDELIGATGIDTMNGGAGEDTFVFEEGDFGAGASRDRIIGFDVGEDVIDLGGQGLQFGGTSSIGGGQASAWIFETPFGSTLLRVDFDGNGSVDGVILLSGTTGLTVDDIIL